MKFTRISCYLAILVLVAGCTSNKQKDKHSSNASSVLTTSILNTGTVSKTSVTNDSSNNPITNCYITFDLEGGTGQDNLLNQTVHSFNEILFFEATKDDYRFKGWSYNGVKIVDENLVVLVQPALTNNMVFKAIFTQTITVKTILSYKDSAELDGAGEYPYNSLVSLKCNVLDGYYFVGWYEDNKLLSKETIFYYQTSKTDVEVETRTILFDTGILPKKYNNYITYGFYPMNNVYDNELINKLSSLSASDDSPWVYLEGKYYGNAIFNSDYSSSEPTFNNEKLVKGQKYWFEVTPITWQILSQNGNDYLCMSLFLIDALPYHNTRDSQTIGTETIYASNYEHSDIRNWLNSDFLDSAFFINNNCLNTFTVNNSSCCDADGQYMSHDTNDKVALLSYNDLFNEDYGFLNDTFVNDRKAAKYTQYTLAKHHHVTLDGQYQYNAEYWTRSPYDDRNVYRCKSTGTFNTATNLMLSYGVRPVVSIHLDDKL